MLIVLRNRNKIEKRRSLDFLYSIKFSGRPKGRGDRLTIRGQVLVLDGLAVVLFCYCLLNVIT